MIKTFLFIFLAIAIVLCFKSVNSRNYMLYVYSDYKDNIDRVGGVDLWIKSLSTERYVLEYSFFFNTFNYAIKFPFDRIYQLFILIFSVYYLATDVKFGTHKLERVYQGYFRTYAKRAVMLLLINLLVTVLWVTIYKAIVYTHDLVFT